MSEITRPVNINLYLSSGIDDDEAERLAAILSEALEEHGFPRVTPDPVPEWSRLVDAMPPKPFTERHPLAEILERLAVLDEYSDTGVDETRLYQMNIARIVAVCEQQVGDGWQADPNHYQAGLELTQFRLGVAFYGLDPAATWAREPGEYEWMRLGNSAAAWLRDLTEGGTA